MSSHGQATRDDGLAGGRKLPLPDVQAGHRDLLRGAGGEPAASDERAGVLARAAAARFPELKSDSGRDRVRGLLDYITDTAILRGELEELRLTAHIDLREHRRQLDRVPTGVTRNKAAIDEAKRQTRPDLAERVDDAQWMVDRCTEQINRMSADYDAASRSYTLLAGT